VEKGAARGERMGPGHKPAAARLPGAADTVSWSRARVAPRSRRAPAKDLEAAA